MKKNDGNSYLDGGHVRGPGTGTSDSIPANLSDGEFVINSAIVKRPGMLAFLKKLNAGDTGIHKYAQGGLVDSAPQIPQASIPIDPNLAPIDQSLQSSQQDPNVDPRLATAMSQRDDQQNKANLLRAFQSLVGSGAYGSGYKTDTGVADNLEKQAEQPVNDVKTQIASEVQNKEQKRLDESHGATMADMKQKLAKSNLDFQDMQANNDPASPQSKLAQDFYLQMAKQSGQPVNEENVRQQSGASLYKLSPEMQKVLHDHFTQENEKLHRQTQVDINSENNATRKDIAETNAQARSDAMSDKADQKQTENDNKDAMKLNDTLDKGWAARGGQAGIVQDKLNSADRAQALLDQGKNQPDGLDSRQIEELAESTSRLIGGSAAASARVAALIPHTLMGRAQTLKEFLSNKPSGQQMQEFTSRLEETINREKQVAQDQKLSFQVGALAAHKRLRESNPDLYNEILSSKGIDPSMIDEKGQYKKPGSSTGPLGDTTVKDGKNYRWNPSVNKYQLDQ